MAGFAVAIAFGILWAILCFARGAIANGVMMLGFTSFLVAMTFSRSASARFLILSVATAVCGIVLAYAAVGSELSGKTVEYHGGRSGFAYARPVTRQDSPEKFRSCTNWRWALSLGFLGCSVVTFKFYRRLESTDWV